MNEPPANDPCPSAREDGGAIEANPDHLTEMEAKLLRGLQRALADGDLDMEKFGHLDLKELARRLASRSRAARRKSVS